MEIAAQQRSITSGYKQTEAGVIPEGWRCSDFAAVTDLITCGIAATPKYVAESDGYPFLSSTNVKDGRIIWDNYKWIDRSLHRQLYRNNPPLTGDILYSRVGTIGEAAVVDVDFEFSIYVSLTLIKPTKCLDSSFLKHLLNSDGYKKRAKGQVYLGSGVGNLNVDVVRQYPIVVPPLPEQLAISGMLDDADELIGALDKLIAKKRDLKQAAMQQLLTGNTRLPGFSGEWEVKKLGEIADIVSGATPKTNVPSYWTGSINWCTPTDITGCSGNYLFETERTISRDGLASCSAQLLPAGSLLLCSRATIGEVRIAGCEICTNQGFKSLVCKPGVSNEFLYYKLLTMKSQMVERAIGSTFLEVSKKDTAALELSVPDYAEQTAIADVLSDMDAEIARLEARRDKTRTIKQGMMQELLTGKTRLI